MLSDENDLHVPDVNVTVADATGTLDVLHTASNHSRYIYHGY